MKRLLGIGLIIFGLYDLFAYINFLQKVDQAKLWPVVNGKNLNIRAHEVWEYRCEQCGDAYLIYVSYRYIASNQGELGTYRNNSVRLIKSYKPLGFYAFDDLYCYYEKTNNVRYAEDARSIFLEEYPQFSDNSFKVAYNPNNPFEAIIDFDALKGPIFFWAMLAGPLGILLLLWGMRPMNKSVKRS